MERGAGKGRAHNHEQGHADFMRLDHVTYFHNAIIVVEVTRPQGRIGLRIMVQGKLSFLRLQKEMEGKIYRSTF